MSGYRGSCFAKGTVIAGVLKKNYALCSHICATILGISDRGCRRDHWKEKHVLSWINFIVYYRGRLHSYNVSSVCSY